MAALGLLLALLASPSGATLPTSVGGTVHLNQQVETAPNVMWLFPQPGAVIGGHVDLQVQASDSIGVLAPADFYYARQSAQSDRLGWRVGVAEGPEGSEAMGHGESETTPTNLASSPYQPVVLEKGFETTSLHDTDYRLTAIVTGVGGHKGEVTQVVTVDNAPPEVHIFDPQPGVVRDVADTQDVVATIGDRHLSSWAAYGEIPGQAIVALASGTSEVDHAKIATWSGHMAPAGYVGPVNIVVTATDTATPRPNVTTTRRTIESNYYLDAFGRLGVADSYEISATVPVTATITGDVSSWSLSVTRQGNVEPIIANTGTAKGDGVEIASFDVKHFGPGAYDFSLVTSDSSGHQDRSAKSVAFNWVPARLTLTYVGPPVDGPMPTDHPLAQFEDPAVSGTVEIRGEITGTNIMAWAIGRPVAAEDPAFSPDGDRVVFASTRGAWPNSNTDIYTMKADGSGLTRLTNDPAYDWAPEFSPDGSSIVFTSTRNSPPTASGTDLYVMNQDGTNIRRLTNTGYAEFPSWSPDGSKIAFDGTVSGDSGLFVMNPDGTEITRVAESGLYPSFSPAGTELAYSYYDNDDPYYHIAKVSITDPAHPSVNIGTGIEPSFSHDGTKIVYLDPAYALYQMGANGENPTAYSVSGNDPVFSPDDTSVIYADPYGQLVVIPADPGAGGQPQVVLEDDGTNRVPGAGTTETAFPPSSTANNVVPVDVSSFGEGSYLKDPPYQFPTNTAEPDSVLGHIDSNKLPAGKSALSVVVIQCDNSIPPLPKFAYRPGDETDPETSATISALANHCNAYAITIVVQVEATRAHLDTTVTVSETAPGYGGDLATPKIYQSSGTWAPPDSWAFRPVPALPESYPIVPEVSRPDLARVGGQMWGSGPPVNDGSAYSPLADLMGLEAMKTLVNEPLTGLAAVSTSAPTLLATNDTYAPGRAGKKYSAPLGAGHFGQAAEMVIWIDSNTELLGAMAYSRRTTTPGPSIALSGDGSWASSGPNVRSAEVRIVFSEYSKDSVPTIPSIPGAGP